MSDQLCENKPLSRGSGDRRAKYPDWVASILNQMNQADVNRLAALLIVSNVLPTKEGRYELSSWLQTQSNRIPILDNPSEIIEAFIIAESGELLAHTLDK